MKRFVKGVSFLMAAVVLAAQLGGAVFAEQSKEQVTRPIQNIGKSYKESGVLAVKDSKSPVEINLARKVGNWVYYKKSSYNYTLSRVNKKNPSNVVKHTETVSSYRTVGAWIYFVNESDKKLYRMKNDGTLKKKILDEPVYLYEIAMSDKWIIYRSQKTNEVFRVKSDGTGTPIKMPALKNCNFYLYGNKVVYKNYSQQGDKTYIMKPDGTDNKALPGMTDISVYDLTYENGYFYYMDYSMGKYMRIKSDGSEKPQTLVINMVYYAPMLKDGWVYYINKTKNYSLFRMKPDGKNVSKIVGQDVLRFSVSENNIFYLDQKSKDIMKVKADGTGKMRVSKNYGYYFQSLGNTVYFAMDHAQYGKVKADGKGQLIPIKQAEYVAATDTSENQWGSFIDTNAVQGLYCMDTATKKSKAVIKGEAYNIILYEDDLYYMDRAGIYRIKSDGSNKKVLYKNGESDMNVNFFKIADGMLYFTRYQKDARMLYSMKLDGSAVKSMKVVDSQIYIAKGFCYYIKYSNVSEIYRLDIATKKEEKVIDEKVTAFYLENNKLFYSPVDKNALICMELDNKNTATILSGETTNVTMSSGWIYYENQMDNNAIYQIKYDGTGKAKVSDYLKRYEVAGDTLYYMDDKGVIYSKKVNEKMTKLTDKVPYYGDYDIADGYIYYNVNNSCKSDTYRIKIGAAKAEKL